MGCDFKETLMQTLYGGFLNGGLSPILSTSKHLGFDSSTFFQSQEPSS